MIYKFIDLVLYPFLDAIANSVYYVADRVVCYVLWFWKKIGPRGHALFEYAACGSLVVGVVCLVVWLAFGVLFVLTNLLRFLNWLMSVGYF